MVLRTRGTCQKGVVWPPRFRGRTIFLEIRKLISGTCIVSGLLCPPRSNVLRSRYPTLGKHLIFPQVIKPSHNSTAFCLSGSSMDTARTLWPTKWSEMSSMFAFRRESCSRLWKPFPPFNTGGITRDYP